MRLYKIRLYRLLVFRPLNAGRLACLLAERADCVVQMFCGLPTVLKGELPPC